MAGCVVVTNEKDLRWRKLMEFLQDKHYGFKATYEVLQALLGVDMTTKRFDIYRANKELERLHNRTLVCVRGEGYRIAEPKEHAHLIHNRVKSARHHIRRGKQIDESTNRSMLTPEEAKQLADQSAHLGRIEQSLKHHGKRLDDVEQRVEAIEKAEMAARLADIQARLSLIEQTKQTP